MTALGFTRQSGETWKEAMIRQCDKFGGLHEEVTAEYEANLKDGLSEDQAAWHALCEWDLLEVIT